jgi:hypothetical protein
MCSISPLLVIIEEKCDTLQKWTNQEHKRKFGEPHYKIVDLCSSTLKQGKLILLTFLSDYMNGIIN